MTRGPRNDEHGWMSTTTRGDMDPQTDADGRLRHLLSLQGLSRAQLETLLRRAQGLTAHAYGGIGVFSEGKDFDDSLIEKDETIALLTSLLDQSPDFYLYKNNRGECVFANEAFRQIAGCQADCLKGKTMTELACYIPAKQLERLNAAEFRVATGQTDSLVFDAEFSGKLYAVEVSRSCDPNGNPLGLLVKGTLK